MQVQQVAELGDDQWQVTVAKADGGYPTDIQIERTVSDFEIPITCTQSKTSPIVAYQRIEKQK